MYQITEEQKARYRANRKAKRDAETPEERELRLAKRRERDRRRREEGGEELRKRTRELAIAWVNKKKLEDCGLWVENPEKTPGWVHFQTLAPKSMSRIFNP